MVRNNELPDMNKITQSLRQFKDRSVNFKQSKEQFYLN